jgi:hypothetical protein
VLSRLNQLEEELRDALRAEQPAEVVVKEDSPVHNALASGFGVVTSVKEAASLLSLDLPVNTPSGPEYLSEFATTLASSIALPRAWHSPEEAPTRLLVVPHEWQHVKQYRDGVAAGWWPKAVSHSVLYLAGVVAKTDDGAEYVAKVEADGYAVTEYMRAFLYGAPRPVEEVVANLRHHYNLVTGGCTTAEALLRSHYRDIAEGEAPNCWAARIASELLTSSRFADLRGSLAG